MALTQNDLMLVAIVPEDLKDKVVDTLMGETFISGFSLAKIQGFSKEHSHYNIREQVEGYRDFFRFEVLHQASTSEQLCELLGKTNNDKRIRYWILPLIEAGVL
ncbi:DUF3240 family protein [Brumicola nitratireducens]|uniref:DUF3240 domain-containing protein n=1 Tax=Glaciecola nitratireducens (strain JCM 12485 / KCTC 12276 / FR1064) TaxID=1085623 RepID=G4QE27_GLANF|nr:DUF3240 family protein [Glaciecola nitratireducens]AEP31301.1 hypothetical protein GNIT_3207 [Glaciecola nitratireducens FR1064]